MKTQNAKTKETTAAPVPPADLELVKCAKCEATYNGKVLNRCPKCSEPHPDMVGPIPPEPAELAPAPVEVIPEFPYLNQPSEQGGVIIEVKSGKVFRDMTVEDVAEAAEEIGKVSITHEEVTGKLRASENRVLDLEQHLKEQRGLVRINEQELLDVGAQLAELGRAVNSGKREWKTQINLTLTPSNEIVETDAKTGKQIGERRTANKEELEKARNRQAVLSGTAPAMASEHEEKVPKAKGGKRKTSDSPSHKPDPGDQLLTVSLSTSAFNRLTPRRKDDMRMIPGYDDAPGFSLNWALSEDGERMSVQIPRRLLGTITTMAGPSLGFKQDTGGVTVEFSPAAPQA